jgi:hypothetical protein
MCMGCIASQERKLMFKNWKTTLFGFIGGLPMVGIQVLNAFGQGQTVDFKQLGLGLGVMLLGAFAKDSNVTGGTTQQ